MNAQTDRRALNALFYGFLGRPESTLSHNQIAGNQTSCELFNWVYAGKKSTEVVVCCGRAAFGVHRRASPNGTYNKLNINRQSLRLYSRNCIPFGAPFSRSASALLADEFASVATRLFELCIRLIRLSIPWWNTIVIIAVCGIIRIK